jgi:glyoxylate utilization-related uncharacterized protein
MPVTHIDTNTLPRVKLAGARGDAAEIVNEQLCGARNVIASLHWLTKDERWEAEPLPAAHQLVYLMEGQAAISLGGKDYMIEKGGGVYLGPEEGAKIAQRGDGALKLLHLQVPTVGEDS